ncbi:MAG: hypothetical protein VW362_11465, partial [Candidatus Nanopelagicales bacterium]
QPDRPVTVRAVVGYGQAAQVPDGIKSAIYLLLGDLYEQRQETITGTSVGKGVWTLSTGANTMKHSRDAAEAVRYTRPITAPAPTVDTKAGSAWVVRHERGAGMADRHGDRPDRPVTDPAPTLTVGANRRLAVLDPDESLRLRLTTVQGCTLQGFPDPERVAAALPSSKGKAWQIIGNAVASPMAARIVEGLL